MSPVLLEVEPVLPSVVVALVSLVGAVVGPDVVELPVTVPVPLLSVSPPVVVSESLVCEVELSSLSLELELSSAVSEPPVSSPWQANKGRQKPRETKYVKRTAARYHDRSFAKASVKTQSTVERRSEADVSSARVFAGAHRRILEIVRLAVV